MGPLCSPLRRRDRVPEPWRFRAALDPTSSSRAMSYSTTCFAIFSCCPPMLCAICHHRAYPIASPGDSPGRRRRWGNHVTRWETQERQIAPTLVFAGMWIAIPVSRDDKGGVKVPDGALGTSVGFWQLDDAMWTWASTVSSPVCAAL